MTTQESDAFWLGPPLEGEDEYIAEDFHCHEDAEELVEDATSSKPLNSTP